MNVTIQCSIDLTRVTAVLKVLNTKKVSTCNRYENDLQLREIAYFCAVFNDDCKNHSHVNYKFAFFKIIDF